MELWGRHFRDSKLDVNNSIGNDNDAININVLCFFFWLNHQHFMLIYIHTHNNI